MLMRVVYSLIERFVGLCFSFIDLSDGMYSGIELIITNDEFCIDSTL